MTALRSHDAAGASSDRGGLTGRTEQQRREIEARIARVSSLKARVEGRPLTPFEIALALGLANDRTPRRMCISCRVWLPENGHHFHSVMKGGRAYFRRQCITCRRRDQTARNRTAEARRRRAARSTTRDYHAEYTRRTKIRYAPTRRGAVMIRLRKARARMATALTERGRERARTAILNLTHEIDRIDREADR